MFIRVEKIDNIRNILQQNEQRSQQYQIMRRHFQHVQLMLLRTTSFLQLK